jgi:hypothetical protein
MGLDVACKTGYEPRSITPSNFRLPDWNHCPVNITRYVSIGPPCLFFCRSTEGLTQAGYGAYQKKGVSSSSGKMSKYGRHLDSGFAFSCSKKSAKQIQAGRSSRCLPIGEDFAASIDMIRPSGIENSSSRSPMGPVVSRPKPSGTYEDNEGVSGLRGLRVDMTMWCYEKDP